MNSRTLRLIYNPYAGRRRIVNQLDEAIRIFQEGGYEVNIHRAKSPGDIQEVASQSGDVDCLVIAGGDGSIHHAVNGLVRLPAELRPPLGILPVGTANDLAFALGIPKGIPAACEAIVRGRTMEMDVGTVNDRHFVNVAAAGLLTDVSPKVDIRIKNALGQLAYYLKGLGTLPTYRSFEIEYEYAGKQQREDVLLVLVVNGRSVGGFRNFFPKASLSDGMLDVVIVRQSGWPETMKLALDIVRGANPSDQLVYFQTNHIVLKTDSKLLLDLDGEWGPGSPWVIKTGPKISVIY